MRMRSRDVTRELGRYLPDLPERDDVLARLGLEQRRSPSHKTLVAMGLFGGGLLVGAGLARMLRNGADGRGRGSLRSLSRRESGSEAGGRADPGVR